MKKVYAKPIVERAAVLSRIAAMGGTPPPNQGSTPQGQTEF